MCSAPGALFVAIETSSVVGTERLFAERGDGMGSIATSVSFSSSSFSKDKTWMKSQRCALQRWRASPCCCSASAKWKGAVALLVVVLVVMSAKNAAPTMGWTAPPANRQFFGSPSSATSPGLGRYTVLINTWKRYELLKKTVHHYSKCNNVDSINVIWSEPERPSRALTTKLLQLIEPQRVKFQFNINEADELNNRFKPLMDAQTEAVFSIDDDVIVPCETMDLAFNAWLSAPDQLVGFVPRMHWLDQTDPEKDSFTYGGWWSVWWTGTYSIVLTKAAFMHKKYLEMYTTQMPATLLQFVKEERNCEDIAMSFLVANATRAPPLWVTGRVYEIGSTGISSLYGHKEHRTNCLNYFTELFGYMPLVSTNVKVVDASHSWLW